MKDHTITVTDALDVKLQELADDINARTGVKMTIPDVIALVLRERVVQNQLGVEVDELTKKADKDLQAAIVAKKTELSDALAVDVPAAPIVP